MSYSHDGVGNISTIADHRGIPAADPKNAGQSFGYDDLNRLTMARGSAYGRIEFNYDRIGNMIHKQSPAQGETDHVDDILINLGMM
ncbi:hypothetical protein KJ966_31500, partial [bacterium]|nr:hypothetical protein [bacterium]